MWLLPVAMTLGTLLYLAFANIEALGSFRHTALILVETLMPVSVFATLFFTFCKVNIRDMKPRPWHAATLILQTVLCLGCAFLIIKFLKPATFSELVAEGVLACLLSPTATAAAVVTGKLGGNAASISTYTLESNLLSALLVPLLCPLIHHAGNPRCQCVFRDIAESFPVARYAFRVGTIRKVCHPEPSPQTHIAQKRGVLYLGLYVDNGNGNDNACSLCPP